MRLTSVGAAGLLLMTIALAYYFFFDLRVAHISALVPEKFSFGIFYRSLNELREIYDAPYQRSDADPARLRLGEPTNNPGLAGVDYEEPAGSIWTEGRDEILLVPVVDVGAFKEAFETERSNLSVRPPHRVAANYLALSRAKATARRGPENPLVRRATDFPLAVAGHPRDASTFGVMLAALFMREARRKPEGVRMLGQEVRRLPTPIAAAVARECRDFLLGFPHQELDGPARVAIEATLSEESAVARSAALAGELDLVDLVATFPFNTVLLAGGVLDAEGWRSMGLPIPVGDAAFAFGLVEKRHHARRFTLLLAARPRDPAVLARLADAGHRPLLDDPQQALVFARLMDGEAEVRTAPLASPPAWLATVLRSSAKKAPPVYVSSTVAQGIWYCAIGSLAEGTVRHALGCLRGARELGVQRAEPVTAHREFLAGPHAGMALVTPAGLKAFRYEMPMVEVASLGAPTAATAVLDVADGQARIDLRLGK
jgi:hypothetical protein